MKVIFKLIFLLFVLSNSVFGQDYYDFRHRMLFAEHLFEEEFYPSSLFECRQILEMELSPEQKDTVLWLMSRNQLGLAGQGEMDTLLLDFSEKSPQLQAWATQLKHIQQLHKWRPGEKKPLATAFHSNEKQIPESLQPSRAWLDLSSALLRHDPSLLDSLSPEARDWPFSKIASANLRFAWKRHEINRPKSPLAAGLMSALIPGSGKIYAGNTLSGVITLITFTGLGFQAREGWRKSEKKWKDPQFIIYGTAALGYYIANIYGSVIQTKKYNVRIETDLHRSVMLSVLVPLEQSLRKWR